MEVCEQLREKNLDKDHLDEEIFDLIQVLQDVRTFLKLDDAKGHSTDKKKVNKKGTFLCDKGMAFMINKGKK